MIPIRKFGRTSGGGSRYRRSSLCGVGAGCDARQCCGRLQLLGRKTPPDEKARTVWDLRDLYPELKPGTIYKYEIKTKAGVPMLKADPYAKFCRAPTEYGICDLGYVRITVER